MNEIYLMLNSNKSIMGLLNFNGNIERSTPLQCQLRDTEKRCSIYRKEKGKRQ